MSSLITAITALWAVVACIYFALFLYRSLVGMKEEDTLFLSAGESRIAAEQHEIMKKITKLDGYSAKLGWTTLGLTLLVGAAWSYDALKQLF